MNNNYCIYKEMLPTVHQIIHLYMTVPIKSVISERSFSALQHVITYLHSSMTENGLTIACYFTFIKNWVSANTGLWTGLDYGLIIT